VNFRITKVEATKGGKRAFQLQIANDFTISKFLMTKNELERLLDVIGNFQPFKD